MPSQCQLHALWGSQWGTFLRESYTTFFVWLESSGNTNLEASSTPRRKPRSVESQDTVRPDSQVERDQGAVRLRLVERL